jgi:hypothetical protein
MPAAGYSSTSLSGKLEIKPGMRVALVGAPAGFETALGVLPAGATLHRGLAGPRDLTIWFVTSRRALEGDLSKVMPQRGSSLWVAWPKKASGVKTARAGSSTVRRTQIHGAPAGCLCGL